MLLPTVLPCPWQAGSDFLHMVLQFAKKRKHPSFKFNQWLLERGPYHPPPAPSPSCHPPPLLPLLPRCRIPEGSRSLAKDGGQPDGPDSWDRDWTSTLEMVPTHQVQGATLDLPTSQAFRLSSATSLPEILEGTEKTSVHRKCVSDLLRLGRQGCPRLFLPGNGQHQQCQKEEGTFSAESTAQVPARAEALVSGYWFALTVGWDGGAFFLLPPSGMQSNLFGMVTITTIYMHMYNFIYVYTPIYLLLYLPSFMQILRLIS